MSEIVSDQDKANAVDLTNARLERVLQETRKDEAKLMRILELRRLRRRLNAEKAKRK